MINDGSTQNRKAAPDFRDLAHQLLHLANRGEKRVEFLRETS